MAEITEVFEDFGENAGKLFKNKKFWLLAGGVGIVALVAGYMKNQQEAEAVMGFEAVGYAGYPTVGGSSSSESVYSESDENLAYFEQLLGETQTEYDSVITEMEDNITTLSNRLTTSEEENTAYLETIERQNAVSQMRANSELYNSLGEGNSDTKEALHAENLAIAEKYGFTFDSTSGNYYDGNGVVYTTAKQQAAVTGKTSTNKSKSTTVNYTTNKENTAARQEAVKTAFNGGESTGGGVGRAYVTYDENKDYTTAIQQAKSSGASQSVINHLYAERNAKIAANPDLKKYQNDV